MSIMPKNESWREGAVALDSLFRSAMRDLASGVSVITVGRGEDRTGMTATSLTSLSVDPPSILICVNRSSSTWPALQAHRHFGVNLLRASQRPIAERFAGRDGAKGSHRYADAGTDEQLMSLNEAGRTNDLNQPSSESGGALRLLLGRLHNRELITAQPCDHIGLANAATQPIGDAFEKTISNRMAQ